MNFLSRMTRMLIYAFFIWPITAKTFSELSSGLISRAPIAVNFSDCYVRWNVVQPGQTTKQARVTQTVWTTTSSDITNTIQNFGNAGNTNTMLWLHDTSALLYAGFFTCQSIPITAQPGLNVPNVVGSIILPSGVAKLNKVGPIPGSLSVQDERTTSIIFGIANKDANNPLTPDDYAYVLNGPYSDNTGGLLEAFRAWSRTNGRSNQVVFNAITGNGDTVTVTVNGVFRN